MPSSISSAFSTSSSTAPSCTYTDCFKILAHSTSGTGAQVDNQYFSVKTGTNAPRFGLTGYTPAIFRLYPSDNLQIVSPELNGYYVGSTIAANSAFYLAPLQEYIDNAYQLASCSRDPTTYGLVCAMAQFNTVSVPKTVTSQYSYNLYWGLYSDSYAPVTLTYEPVDCPC
ncbi:hypothetical protein Sste5346_004366 [Sporothrix stenoceras]|uniref:Uncharacterized protein n=1 Tax=Sporothrix stenoceras TaxID=5173 RepID=A0ABR3ZAR7_9PEZI